MKVSSHFDICSFVQISRNLGVFESWKMYYISGNKLSTLEKFEYSVDIILSSAHMFYLFFFIHSGGTKMSAS